MTNKEYQNKLADHIQYGMYDYLYPDDEKYLRKDITRRKKNGSIVLDGFNNRASIKQVSNGAVLTSYYTDVAAVVDGRFIKLWHGYSVTTLKHVNIFRHAFGLPSLSKREWIAIETETI